MEMTKPIKSKAKVNKNNSTGFHGVTKNSKGEYIAQIWKKGTGTVRLADEQGNKKFKTAIAAARVYDLHAPKYHGEKAKLNFPNKEKKSLADRAMAAVLE
jgi:hypothetical protein